MTAYSIVRDYENPSLSLEERLPSLARRFTCLRDADGLKPWSLKKLHSWVMNTKNGSAAWHAGHMILNLFGTGTWDKFDAIAAVRTWNEADRNLFATWVRNGRLWN
jgi:hypothetical protein